MFALRCACLGRVVYFSVLAVDLVADEHDGNVLAHTNQILVPTKCADTHHSKCECITKCNTVKSAALQRVAKISMSMTSMSMSICVPVRDGLVCDARGDVEHDDRRLTANIVTVTKTTCTHTQTHITNTHTCEQHTSRRMQMQMHAVSSSSISRLCVVRCRTSECELWLLIFQKHHVLHVRRLACV